MARRVLDRQQAFEIFLLNIDDNQGAAVGRVISHTLFCSKRCPAFHHHTPAISSKTPESQNGAPWEICTKISPPMAGPMTRDRLAKDCRTPIRAPVWEGSGLRREVIERTPGWTRARPTVAKPKKTKRYHSA